MLCCPQMVNMSSIVLFNSLAGQTIYLILILFFSSFDPLRQFINCLPDFSEVRPMLYLKSLFLSFINIVPKISLLTSKLSWWTRTWVSPTTFIIIVCFSQTHPLLCNAYLYCIYLSITCLIRCPSTSMTSVWTFYFSLLNRVQWFKKNACKSLTILPLRGGAFSRWIWRSYDGFNQEHGWYVAIRLVRPGHKKPCSFCFFWNICFLEASSEDTHLEPRHHDVLSPSHTEKPYVESLANGPWWTWSLSHPRHQTEEWRSLQIILAPISLCQPAPPFPHLLFEALSRSPISWSSDKTPLSEF